MDITIPHLLAACPVPALVVDAELRASGANHAWGVATGQTADAAAGHGWLSALDESGRDGFCDAVRAAFAGTLLRGRLLVDGPDEPRWFHVVGIPLDDPTHHEPMVLLELIDVTADVEAQRQVHELTRVVEALPDLVGVLDVTGHRVVWANRALRRLLDPARGDELVRHLDEWSQARLVTTALPEVQLRGSWHGELTLLGEAGHPVPAAVQLTTGHDGTDLVTLVARDLRDLLDAEQRVRETEIRLAALVEHAPDMVVVLDDRGHIRYVSPAVDRVLGHDLPDLEGRPADELVHPDDAETAAALVAQLDGPGAAAQAEVRVRDRDGAWHHLELVATNLLDNPAVRGIVVNARDVTDRVAAARALEEQAFSDGLTGLPNRARLLQRLEHALADARTRGRMVGVLFIDLDRFKVVNDSLGHSAGDELLREVGRRISDTVRPADTVARLGGDEFVVIVAGVARRSDIEIAADRIRRAVARPIAIQGEGAVVTASIGIALATGSERAEDLLRDSDTALYQAKERGRDRADVFDDLLRERAKRRLAVERDLRTALDAAAVVVHHQPILSLADGSVTGAEALARIPSGDELLAPGEFIEVAEESGLITRLGHLVLNIACRDAAVWTERTGRRLDVSVNVSARQLGDPRLPTAVTAELAASGLLADQLRLEITESALVDASPVTEKVLAELAELGVHLGLDDFGTGFSSLVYLKRFPIDFVKIDRSFTRGLGTDENDTAIVRATIALAHSLGLDVVAEGVETDEQLRILEQLGCDRAQGYLFSPAVPTDAVERLLGLRWVTEEAAGS